MICQKDALQALHALAYSETAGVRPIKRARMVLACIGGETRQSVANRFQTPVRAVAAWCDRFARSGVNGLLDKPRRGRPPLYDAEFRAAVLQLLDGPPPAGRKGWSGTSIAMRLHVPTTAVFRLLRREGICLSQRPAGTQPPRYLAQRAYVQHLLAVEPGSEPASAPWMVLSSVCLPGQESSVERIACGDWRTAGCRDAGPGGADDQALQHLRVLAQDDGESNLRLAERARMVLAALGEQPVREIARSFQTSGYTVRFWKNRFKSSGVLGLLDMPRRGRPPAARRLALGNGNTDP
ncbi:MAG: helix-turn-helix domain-containing protein [Magnetococcales bacterium]|nr:helix-turn-helix domain-containing protein [Magnetococcales bacterium]